MIVTFYKPVYISVAGLLSFGMCFFSPPFVCLFGVSSSGATNVLILQCSLGELFEEKQFLVQNDDKKIPKTSDQEGKRNLQACKPKQRHAINMCRKG